MKNVFVAGSRRVSHLGADVRRRLDEMIHRELAILVGDANGADKAIQAYFAERSYKNVTVFCTAGDCRNNVGGWAGLMLWDGQSTGTMVNVARLVARGKIAVIYLSPATKFFTIKTTEDLGAILLAADHKVRAKIAASISEHVSELAQPQMF